MPDNADAEVLQCVGTQFVHERYYRVDRHRKALQLLGGNDVPEETTDPHPPGWSKVPLVEAPVGGWSWHIHPAGDLQHALNANNTVLRCVNFKSGDVIRTGDPTKSMSFFIARPVRLRVEAEMARARAIPPGLDVPICTDLLPPRVDDTESRLYSMQRFFDDKNVFRAPNEPGPVRVEYSAVFKAVSQVEPHSERFWGELEVELNWAVTKQDVADYVAHPNVAEWVPTSFCAPALAISNVSASKGSEAFVEDWGPIKVKIMPDRRVVAVKRLRAQGDFHEPFELESYPFDVQPLDAFLETEDSHRRGDLCFVPMPKDDGLQTEVRDTEWQCVGSGSKCSFVPDDADADLGSAPYVPCRVRVMPRAWWCARACARVCVCMCVCVCVCAAVLLRRTYRRPPWRGRG